MLSRSYRLSPISSDRALQAQSRVDDAGQLVGIGRIGGITGALQALREALRRTGARDDLAVARAVLHHLRVVAERVGVRRVGAELGDHLARDAIDVLGGGHL